MYPPLAAKLGLPGRALLSCTVDALGMLVDCQVPFVAPKGLGFDRAALDLAPHFRMRPKIIDGRPVDGGNVRIPLSFRLPPNQPVTARPAATAENLDLARQVASLSEVDQILQAGSDEIENLRVSSAAGMDPVALKVGVVALRQARHTASVDLTETVALILATSLSRRDLTTWLAYLNSPVAATMKQRQSAISAEWTDTVATHRRKVLAAARETFCKSRDCSLSPNLAALRRVIETREMRVSDPEWSEAPSQDHIRAAYPVVPRALGIDGWALLHCRANAFGLLQGCAVAAEMPANLGFGAAALSLADRYRLSARMVGQGAAEEVIEFPVAFATGWAPPKAATANPQSRPSALALGRQILSANGYVDMVGREATAKATEITNAPQAELDWNTKWQATQAFWDAVGEDTPHLLNDLAAVYSRYLTDNELRAYLDFLQTPAGKFMSRVEMGLDSRITKAIDAAAISQTAIAREIYCTTQDCSIDFPQPQAGPKGPAP